MRKNQFRSILLASLVVTAIGGLNSCKDYDDDIAELRQEIRTQSTDLNSLVADKVHNLEIEAAALQQQLSSLEGAYKAADAALQTSINNAVADAKNFASSEAASKADAAEKAATSYANMQAAEAQRAAIAAATTMVNDAQNSLSSAIAAANATITEQGKSIANLLQADKELQQGINAATARANEAYTLANQALDAAKAAQAAADKAQGAADEAKLQAAQNAGTLQTLAENLKKIQEDLDKQVNVFGSQLTAAQTQAEANKAAIEAQAVQLADMKAANDRAQASIDALGNKLNDQVDALKSLITANQTQIAVLQQGVETLKTDVEALKSAFGTANADIKDLKAAVAGLLSTTSGLDTKFTTSLSELKDIIAALTAQLSSDEASISANSAAINALQNLVSALEGRVANTESGVSENAKAISSLQALIAQLKTGDIAGLKMDLNDLKNALSEAQTVCDAKIEGVDNKVSAANSKISDLEGNLAALQAVVDALTGTGSNNTQSLVSLINDLNTKVGANTANTEKAEQQIIVLQSGLVAANQQAEENLAIAKAYTDLAVSELAKELDETNTSIDDLQKKNKEFEQNLGNLESSIQSVSTMLTGMIGDLIKDIEKLQEADTQTAGQISAIQGQISAIMTLIGQLKEADTELASNFATALNELSEKLSGDITDAVNAAKTETEGKISSLQGQITGLLTAVGNLQTAADEVDGKIEAAITGLNLDEKLGNLNEGIATNKGTIEQLDGTIQQVIASVAELKTYMDRALTSVTLIPRLYIDGIEAIEFKTLVYNPRKVYKGNDYAENNVIVNVKNNGENQIRVDNKQTTALYRLSPNNVDDNSYNIDEVSVVSNIANTRGATGPEANSLVSVDKATVDYGKDGSKIMTVYLKKNDATTRLGSGLNADQIRTISLMVPRNPDYQTEKGGVDVYSEYSRIVETEFTPYIAALPYSTHNSYGWQPHYSDFAAIYASLIDKDDRVTKEIYYKDELDLLTLVTGDYFAGNAGNINHTQITKDELKQFGLAFRFAIPTEKYNDVTHSTNQQEFAKLKSGNGGTNNIIYSVLPDDPVYGHDNEAVVGKEPIVCVTLEDTVNNKLVDQRYFKIKWVNKKLPDVKLEDKKNLDMKLSCTSQTVSMTWKEVINKVYGMIKDENGEIVGMSQSRFELNYPIANMTWEVVGDAKYVRDVKAEYGSADGKNLPGADDGLAPMFENTTNAEGDAILVRWKLGIDEIGTLPEGDTGRTFTIRVNFNSGDPASLPNLYFYWTVKYTLPENKSTVGKNTINWNPEASNVLWVLPVQMGTSTAGAKVKYEFNLMAAFTRPTTGNEWVVRNLMGNCPAWDFQFATKPNQDVLKNLGDNLAKYDVQYHYENEDLNYQPLRPYTWVGDNMRSDFDKSNAPYTWSMANGATTTQKTDKAYVFYNQTGNQVLNIEWGGSHPADNWVENAGAATATLKADNNLVYPILNPLKDEMQKDQITPKYSYSKLIKMNIWGELNPWNYYEVGNSPFYLAFVEPIRVDASFDDYFVDGIQGGSRISCAQGLTMTDFAGYVVRKDAFTPAEIAAGKKVGTKESCLAHAPELWTYYGIDTIIWNEDGVKYGLKVDANNDLVPDESVTVSNVQNANKGLTGSSVKAITSEGVQPSVTYDDTTDELVFLNLGGQNVGFDYNAFVPVEVKYELGTITRYVKIVIHPRGYSVKKKSF